MNSELPSVAQRVRAVVYDSFILIFLMAISSLIFAKSEDYDHLRLVAFFFIFGLYDPLTTTLLGGTLGHLLCGLRVVKGKKQSDKINIIQAIIRFLVKWPLGWISLLTVQSSKNRQAIHDHVVGSLVVYR